VHKKSPFLFVSGMAESAQEQLNEELQNGLRKFDKDCMRTLQVGRDFAVRGVCVR